MVLFSRSSDFSTAFSTASPSRWCWWHCSCCWLCWVFFALTTGTARVWVNGVLNALSLLIVLYLVRKDENSAYKVGWIALIGCCRCWAGRCIWPLATNAPPSVCAAKCRRWSSPHGRPGPAARACGRCWMPRAGAEPLCGPVRPLSGMEEHHRPVFCLRRGHVSAAAGRSGKG